MSRNATASWSGYCHQGKVGLLVSLRKIKSLNCENLELLRMELETKEDVRLVDNDTDVEIHQVKAYTEGTTIGPYTTALTEFESCPGENYLHSICEITNWGNLTAINNPHSVIRYPYSAALNYCALADIDNYILEEIKNVLDLIDHPNRDNIGWRQNAFNEYLAILDRKIRIEHATKASKNDYQIVFTLNEILTIVTVAPTHYKMVINSIRSQIYHEYITLIEELDEGGIVLNAAQEEKAKNMIEAVCLLDDVPLESFLCKVWPATTSGKNLAEQVLTGDFFSRSSFSDTFLDTIFKVTTQTPSLEEGVCPVYKIEHNYVLIAINNPVGRESGVTRDILKNKNFNIERYDTDYIINENFSGRLSDHGNRVIPPRNFMKPKDPEYLRRLDAIDKLNL